MGGDLWGEVGVEGDESVFFLADGEEAFTGGVVVGFYYVAGVPEVGCLAAGAPYFI